MAHKFLIFLHRNETNKNEHYDDFKFDTEDIQEYIQQIKDVREKSKSSTDVDRTSGTQTDD